MIEAPVSGHFLLEADRVEATVVETRHLVLERVLLEAGVTELEILVGGLEAMGVVLDLVALLLDASDDARERAHHGADLFVAAAQSLIGLVAGQGRRRGRRR